jgi:hypothetical protein
MVFQPATKYGSFSTVRWLQAALQNCTPAQMVVERVTQAPAMEDCQVSEELRVGFWSLFGQRDQAIIRAADFEPGFAQEQSRLFFAGSDKFPH